MSVEIRQHDIILEPIKQKTATELVAQKLVELLSTGVLKPGSRLPAERDLASQMDVGRTTVREALKLLTLSGLLEVKRGDGTYVSRNFNNFLSNHVKWPLLLSAIDVEAVVEVREALEMKAVHLAAIHATTEELEKIAAYHKMLEDGSSDIEQETEIDLKFHHAIATASHNELLCRLMLSLQDILREYVLLSNRNTDRSNSPMSEHQAILDAISSGNPKEAEKAMMNHLSISKTWILDAGKELGR
ncbi:MAG: FadR family transcriptional regulator [Spirochaetaceae bacterium]|nr:FadR family transcriptional regulator [Spirochaetaceae bacterium]